MNRDSTDHRSVTGIGTGTVASSHGGAHPYYGNYLTCTAGVCLILSILLFISAGIGNWLTHPERVEITIAILVPTLLFTIIFGSNLYYFCISGSYFEIRNHIFPWVLKIHHLDEIEGVEFRKGSLKRSDGLRVKRKDGPWTRVYHAGSLRHKNWRAFEKALQRRGIPVENRLRQVLPAADTQQPSRLPTADSR